MGELNGKKKGQKTQVRRANQGCNGDIASKGDSGVRSVGPDTQPIGTLRVDRPDRVGRNRTRFVLGGILAQLIDETEDQLGDAQECIAREKRRIAKLQQKLDNLKQLQELQEDNTN